MDFGLARATGLAGASSSGAAGLTHSPTIAQPLTAEGTIVGTFQYMSPEQLEGKEADARSDIWALGCVLYEMATGKRAYEGSTQASLISAIMRDQPRPMAELAPMTRRAGRLVLQCLAGDPDDRWQRRAISGAGGFRHRAAWCGAGAPGRVGRGNGWCGAAVVLRRHRGTRRTREQPAGSRVISAILAPPNTDFDTRTLPLAVSPDGRMIALACEDSAGTTSLWLRSLDTKSPPLPGTGVRRCLSWCDSRDMPFRRTGQAHQPHRRVAPGHRPRPESGGDARPDGFILVSSGYGLLWRIAERPGSGGGSRLPQTQTAGNAGPIVLPGATSFRFAGQHAHRRAKGGTRLLDMSDPPVLIVPEAKRDLRPPEAPLLEGQRLVGAALRRVATAFVRPPAGSRTTVANVQLGCGSSRPRPPGSSTCRAATRNGPSWCELDRAGRSWKRDAPGCASRSCTTARRSP
jgi:hypothetical protein